MLLLRGVPGTPRKNKNARRTSVEWLSQLDQKSTTKSASQVLKWIRIHQCVTSGKDNMAEAVHNDGEILQPLPENWWLPADASAHRVIDWINNNRRNTTMIPTAWILFQTRIQEHPNEATEVESTQVANRRSTHSQSPHSRFSGNDTPVPLSVVELLIDVHPEGLGVQDAYGCVPLHYAVSHPDIACFRAVLYNGSIEATITQNSHGNTPLRYSSWLDVGLARMWEITVLQPPLCQYSDNEDRTLDFLEHYQFSTRRRKMPDPTSSPSPGMQRKSYSQWQHSTIMSLKLPSDETIAIIESSPACAVLAPRLEPGNDAFILHHALAAMLPVCPGSSSCTNLSGPSAATVCRWSFASTHCSTKWSWCSPFDLLASTHPAAMEIADPVTGLFPIEQAILNLGNNESLGNVDAVHALLRADPAYLERTD